MPRDRDGGRASTGDSHGDACAPIRKSARIRRGPGSRCFLLLENHIVIDSGRHRLRIARVQRMTALFPDPMPRLPIPRYLANGLFALTGRTLTPVLSFSNSNTSPARTPSALRMAIGTVIRPFDVIFACFTKCPASWFITLLCSSLLWHQWINVCHRMASLLSRIQLSERFPNGRAERGNAVGMTNF
jgi:hypothetical protein